MPLHPRALKFSAWPFFHTHIQFHCTMLSTEVALNTAGSIGALGSESVQVGLDAKNLSLPRHRKGKCCLPGCTRVFPDYRPRGWTCTFLKEHPRSPFDKEMVGPVCGMHHSRIRRADKHNCSRKKMTSAKRAHMSWTHPVLAAIGDMDTNTSTSNIQNMVNPVLQSS